MVVEEKCCFVYVKYCRLMWCTTLHRAAGGLEAFNKHMLPCICNDKKFVIICLSASFPQ